MEKLNKIRDLLPIPSFGVIIVCFFFPFVIVQCGGRDMISLSGTQLALGTKIDESKIKKEKMMESIFGNTTEAEDNINIDDNEEETTTTLQEEDAEKTDYADEYTANDTESDDLASNMLKGKDKKIESSIILLIPFLLAIAGFIVAFFRFKRKPLIFIILSTVGFLCLFLFKLAWMAKMNEGLGNMNTDDFGLSMMFNIKLGNAFYIAMFLFVAIALFFIYYLYENRIYEKKQLALAKEEAMYNYDEDLDDETIINN